MDLIYKLTVNAPMSNGVLSSPACTHSFAAEYNEASSSEDKLTSSPCSPFKNAISDFNAATSVRNLHEPTRHAAH